jgi:hypothetical protein
MALAQSPADPPTVIKLRPAAEPRPALKYRLVPERLDLVPGNAAVFYHRAIEMTVYKRRSLADQEKEKVKEGTRTRAISDEDLVSEWIYGPIAEIPREKAREMLRSFEGPLKEVELGATRSTCDWEFDRRNDGFYLVIEEIQRMRGLARLVSLRARMAILDGKTDEAMHWIETGLVMGRHVSQGPIIIQMLVGVAIDSVMTQCLEDLIQVPGTPSLYWALADRPRPFVDLRYSLEGERQGLEKEIPGLLELEQGPWGLDKAKKFSDELQRKIYALGSDFPTKGSDGAVPDEMLAAARRLGIAAMTAKIYPEARRALIAQGRPEAEVDAMPVVQAATLYCYQEYRRSLDNTYKWMNLPYWQSHNRVDASYPRTVEQKMKNPLLTIFQMVTPALNSARMAPIRLDRKLDALQCVEAIRLYAAAHEGKLPASLDAIVEAPVPIDLMTGKPFEYKLDGDQATLSAPIPPGAPNHPSFAIRYVLKLVK